MRFHESEGGGSGLAWNSRWFQIGRCGGSQRASTFFHTGWSREGDQPVRFSGTLSICGRGRPSARLLELREDAARVGAYISAKMRW